MQHEETIAGVRYVPISVAARMLGVTSPRAYERVRQGRLPAIRHGARMLVPVDELELLLTVEHRQTATRASNAVRRWADAADWAKPDWSGGLDRDAALRYLAVVDIGLAEATLACLGHMVTGARIIAEAAVEAGWVHPELGYGGQRIDEDHEDGL